MNVRLHAVSSMDCDQPFAITLTAASSAAEGRPAFLAIAVAVASGSALLRGWATTPVVVATAAALGVMIERLRG